MRQRRIYAAIREAHTEKGYPIELACELLHVSRSAYHKWASGKLSRRAAENERLADTIEKIHEEYVSAIQYNNENSLSSVLALAYLSAMQYYFKPVREFPTGRGFADFVFIPKTEYRNDYPALVVELKWNKSAVSALQQIKDKKYPDSIQKYAGNILLVGINYSKKEKKHECMIEEYLKK